MKELGVAKTKVVAYQNKLKKLAAQGVGTEPLRIQKYGGVDRPARFARPAQRVDPSAIPGWGGLARKLTKAKSK